MGAGKRQKRGATPPHSAHQEPQKVTRSESQEKEPIDDLSNEEHNLEAETQGIARIIDPKQPVRLNMGGGRPHHDPIQDILSGMMGGEDLFGDDEDEDKEGDYIQEKTTKDGRHIHKEVHNHNGVKQVHMRVEGGPGMMMGGFGGPPPGLIEALMGGMLEEHPQRRAQ